MEEEENRIKIDFITSEIRESENKTKKLKDELANVLSGNKTEWDNFIFIINGKANRSYSYIPQVEKDDELKPKPYADPIEEEMGGKERIIFYIGELKSLKKTIKGIRKKLIQLDEIKEPTYDELYKDIGKFFEINHSTFLNKNHVTIHINKDYYLSKGMIEVIFTYAKNTIKADYYELAPINFKLV